MTVKPRTADSSLIPVHVIDLDNPNAPPRKISLPPQDAVLWCHADSVGDRARYMEYRRLLAYHEGMWICGRWACRG